MDELTLLTRRHADVPEPDAATLQTARRRLVDRMATPDVAVLADRRRRGLRRAAVAVAAVAAVAAGTIVIAGTGDDGSGRSKHRAAGPPSAPASVSAAPRMVTAAQFLDSAAAKTVRAGDPTLAPGEYTYVRTHAWFADNYDAPNPGSAPSGPSGSPVPAVKPARQVTALGEDQYEVWVPKSSNGTWYWRYTRPIATKFFSAADRRYVEKVFGSSLKRQVEYYSGKHGQIQHTITAGKPDGPAAEPVPVTWGVPTPAFLAALPRNPQALLQRLYVDPNKPDHAKAHRDDLAMLHIAQVLSSGIVPADLRAALYQAATKIPGVRITDSTTDLDGRPGLAVGRVNSSGRVRQDIIFDSAGGQYIGERQVVLHGGGDYLTGQFDVPDGTAIESTAVTIGVAHRPHF